jgi:hypothetical protein
LLAALTAAGLDDPLVFEAVRFWVTEDLLSVLFPGRELVLSTDAIQFVEALLVGAAGQARLALRLEDSGSSGGLGDALWVARASRGKAQEVESSAAASTQSAGPGRTEAAHEWRPCKRVRRAAGLGEADLALMSKWSGRLAVLLRMGGTPAWRQAQAAADPAAASAGLVGKARPSTVKKRVRDWEVFARRLLWYRWRRWPVASIDLVDYLAARMPEGCPPSFPEALRSTVIWVEARSGYVGEETYGREEFFKKNVDR